MSADSSTTVPVSEGTTINLSDNTLISDNFVVNYNATIASLTVTGPAIFNNDTVNPIPTTSSSDRGLGIYWNVDVGLGETTFLNYGQKGGGGFTFYTCTITNSPSMILRIDPGGNLFCSALNCTSVVNSGTLQCTGLSSTGNILAGTNSVSCGTLNCTSVNNSGSSQCVGLTSTGNISAGSNSVTCGTLNCTSVNNSGSSQCVGVTSTGPITAGTQSVTCGTLNCTSVVDTGTVQCNGLSSSGNIAAGTNSVSCGTLNCTSVNNSGSSQCVGLTSTAAISAGTNSVTCGTVNCSSLVNSGLTQCVGLTSTGNISAGTNSITCGTLSCTSEVDTGSLSCTSLSINGLSVGYSSSLRTGTLFRTPLWSSGWNWSPATAGGNSATSILAVQFTHNLNISMTSLPFFRFFICSDPGQTNSTQPVLGTNTIMELYPNKSDSNNVGVILGLKDANNISVVIYKTTQTPNINTSVWTTNGSVYVAQSYNAFYNAMWYMILAY